MINKITIKNNVKIIDNSYVIKKKQKSLTDTYNYLLSRSFDYFPEVVKEDDKYIYYWYINGDYLILRFILSRVEFRKDINDICILCKIYDSFQEHVINDFV